MKRDNFLKNQVNKVNGENQVSLLSNQLKNCQLELATLKNSYQKRILMAIIAAKESERYNISRTLHDSICQLLYGIKLNLQSIHDLKHSKNELNNLSKLIDQAISEVRDISHSLTPTILKDFGFIAGMKEMTKRLNTKSFKINASISATMDNLSADIQLYIFRIVQELVNNCIKHAAATRVIISIIDKDEMVKITVKDNGRGFKAKAIEAVTVGSGLRSIKMQAFLINGELTYQTTENGTTVRLICNKRSISQLTSVYQNSL